MTSSTAPAETIEIAGITMSANPEKRPFPDLSTIKAVLFDVDGTLTNSDPLHFDAFHDILLEYDYKVQYCTVPMYCHLRPSLPLGHLRQHRLTLFISASVPRSNMSDASVCLKTHDLAPQPGGFLCMKESR